MLTETRGKRSANPYGWENGFMYLQPLLGLVYRLVMKFSLFNSLLLNKKKKKKKSTNREHMPDQLHGWAWDLNIDFHVTPGI